MTDVMLLYMAPGRWPAQHMRPYVAHLDKHTGKAKDWFFDGWLFLMYGGAPSKQAYINGATNKADWTFFLDLLYKPRFNLDALNKCIAQVGRDLGERDKVYPVIIMIPYPSTKQRNFGDVDGDGRSEDLSAPADRRKVVQWFVDETLARRRRRSYPHLKLWGFYWMNEGIGARDERIVRETADYVHRRGVRMHWIPWYAAPGYDRWRALGLDFVVMQPNFAFLQPKHGLKLPNDDRLSDNANRARAAGLGVEMEMNGRETTQWQSRWNLQQYLNHGVDELDGYMKGAARAWYQSYDSVRKLYESDNPQCNRLYDDIYRFHKGVYQRRRLSLADGCACTVECDGRRMDGAKLIDGLWVTRGERMGRVIEVRGKHVVIKLDLGTDQLVDDVRIHLVGGDFPSHVRVRTARAVGPLREAGGSEQVPAFKAGDWTVGFASVAFAPRVARYVEVELAARTSVALRVDEVVLPPAEHALMDAQCESPGQIPRGDIGALTDGRCPGPGVRWRGKGEVRFKLRESVFARMVRVHAPGRGVRAQAVVGKAAFSMLRAGDWLEADLGLLAVTNLALALQGMREFCCDEVQLLPAVSIAVGKPYTLAPGFKPTYPDAGGELTDGVLCAAGFGDGRTVGWVSSARRPKVTIDLGGAQPVDAVRIHAEGGGYGWVNFPHRVEVSVSIDGTSWERVAAGAPKPDLTASRVQGGARMELGWQTMRFPSVDARWVAVSVQTRGWAMLSEIEVLNHGTNVARGASYALQPPPSSTTKYADNSGVLTDGSHSPGMGWKGCVGWCEAEPTITVDLQSECDVGALAVRLIGGGAGGVWFPKRVEFSVSSDGKSWIGVGAATTRPAESGTSAIPGRMGIMLSAATRARYVRARLVRKGWVMPDEIEVYPAPR